MKKLIAYRRVSTSDQRIAGNGLEAQSRDIDSFAAAKGYSIIAEYCEDVSGKYGLDRRPQLAAAIAQARKEKAFLVVSKLDRLSRDAHFILTLMKEDVKFIVCSLGENVDDFSLHIFASLGQMERKMIGERTKAGLASVKARGGKLGFQNAKVVIHMQKAHENARKAVTAEADSFALHMQPVIGRMLAAKMSYRDMAKELNSMGNKTQRGGAWYASTVGNIVKRMTTI